MERLLIITCQLTRYEEKLDTRYMIDFILEKFSNDIRREVYRLKLTNHKEWSTSQMFADLEKVIQIEEDLELCMGNKTVTKKGKDLGTQSHAKAKPNNEFGDAKRGKQESQCTYCNGKDHHANECDRVKSNSERRAILQREERCLNCRGSGHVVKDCKSKRSCDLCQRRHNTSICPTRENMEGKTLTKQGFKTQNGVATHTIQTEVDEDEMTNTASHYTASKVDTKGKTKGYLPTVQTEARNTQTNEWVSITIMIDSGATNTFIKDSTAKNLKLKQLNPDFFPLEVFNSYPSEIKKFERSMVELRTGNEPILIDTLHVSRLTGRVSIPELTKEDKNFIKRCGIDYTPDSGNRTSEPDIIIGCDHFGKIVTEIVNLPSGLSLWKTIFGFIPMGSFQKEMNQEITDYPIAMSINTEQDLEYWEQRDLIQSNPNEFTGPTSEEKEETDRKVVQFFKETVEKREKGYFVRLPVRPEIIKNLPDNYVMAKKRLDSVLKSSSQEAKEEIDKVFKEQLEKGILEIVKGNERKAQRVHYNPHQPVFTPEKEYTRTRVVVDGAAHYKGKPSLNDALFQGPVILPGTNGILVRFRAGESAIVADVEKAFLQIHLHEDDRDLTRVLWVKDIQKPATEDNTLVLRFSRVLFGLNASPFLLGMTIKHHLSSHEDKKLAEEMSRNLYVDNLILTSDGSRRELLEIYKVTKTTFSEMNMNLRAFLSNDLDLMERIKDQDRADIKETKILGILWDPTSDEIRMTSGLMTNEVNTRRTIASDIHKAYDPLGLLSPLFLPLKIFQRKLWVPQEKYGWDTPLKQEHHQEWMDLAKKAEKFEIRLPRNVIFKSGPNHIVAFADASKEATAYCIYICNGMGSHLLMGKSNVKPLNEKWTIPKMEMHAIKLCTEKTDEILFELLEGGINVKEVIILSDSEIALSWIKSTPGKKEVGIFVTNRINDTTKSVELMTQRGVTVYFGHVGTTENPADLGTRGLNKDQLEKSNLWWCGPEFINEHWELWIKDHKTFKLNVSEEDWVRVNISRAIEAENTDRVFEFEKTNSLSKMTRVAVYVFRAIRKMLKNSNDEVNTRVIRNIPELRMVTLGNDPVSSEEGKSALKRLIKQHQKDISLQKKKKWENLRLQLDEDGIVVCRGRLNNIRNDNEMAKTPILIEPNTQFARMIIWESHGKYHCNEQETMSVVRGRFWIPRLRQQVKKLIRKCVKCQRYNSHPFRYPDMNDMPNYRVQRASPFQNTGLDYMGPLTYRRENNSKESCWFCLFSCATTRLVHIEVVEHLHTVAFVNAIRRFISIRGVPQKIISDNAPQFILAERILKDSKKEAHDVAQLSCGKTRPEILEFLGKSDIQWKFITPYAPWMGGMYERQMKSVKQALHKAIGRQVLPLDDLRTMATEIAAMLNGRPLTYVGDQITDGAPLRPNDFVSREIHTYLPIENAVGSTDNYFPPDELRTTKAETVKAFQKSNELLEKVWKRWSTEYLAELRQRHKIRMDNKANSKTKPTVGQIVLIHDANQPRNFWKLAQIVEVTPSRDGVLREVVLKTRGDKLLKRPINLVTPLEMDVEEDSEEELERQEIVQLNPNPRYNFRHRNERNYDEDVSGEEEGSVNQSNAFCGNKKNLNKILTIGTVLCLMGNVDAESTREDRKNAGGEGQYSLTKCLDLLFIFLFVTTVFFLPIFKHFVNCRMGRKNCRALNESLGKRVAFSGRLHGKPQRAGVPKSKQTTGDRTTITVTIPQTCPGGEHSSRGQPVMKSRVVVPTGYKPIEAPDRPHRVLAKKTEPNMKIRVVCVFCEIPGHLSNTCPDTPFLVDRMMKLFEKNRCHKCLEVKSDGHVCAKTRACYYCSSEEHHAAVCGEPRTIVPPEQSSSD